MANTKITSRVIADDAILTANIADDQITSALIADDVALGGNPTTTTQSAGNNTTRIATTAFVSTAVANIVNSAPATLDTLGEIATALNNDAALNTTLTNSIATKAPLASPTFTGALTIDDITIDGSTISDSGTFGIDAGGNIELDADGGQIIFVDGGTNIGRLENSSSDFVIKSMVDNKDIIFKGEDGGSGITALTLDMSDAGKATFNNGVVANASGGVVTLGANGHVTSKQSLDTATAGGRFIGESNRGHLGEIAIEQTADSTDGGYIRFATAASGTTSSTTHMTLASNGKLGLHSGLADTQLHVKNEGGIEVRLEADSNNNGQEDCFIRFYTDGKTQEGIAGMDNNNSSTLFSGNTENAMVFGTVSNLPVVFATNNTERVQITNSGNLGINCAGSNAKLEVVATSGEVFRADSNNGAYRLVVLQTGVNMQGAVAVAGQVTATAGAASAPTYSFIGDTDTGISRPTTNAINFVTNGAEKMRVGAAGDICIGTTSGASVGGVIAEVADNDTSFYARGSNGRVNFKIHTEATGGRTWYFRTGGTAHFGSGGGDLLVLNEAGTAIMTWDYSSSTINGDFNDTSDIGLKENIEDITDGITKIKALKPRTFDWKDKTKLQGTHGFVAQEVETVLPNDVVGENYDAENPEHGSKSLNTSGLLAVAVKAIQEQQEQIETLKKEVEELKGG